MSEDWAQWSKDAVSLMSQRNAAWEREYRLSGAPYQWTLDPPELVFDRGHDEVVADICVVGTASPGEGTYLWAWANEAIPETARRGLDEVRLFGRKHDLPLLFEPMMEGGLPEGKECAAIAGRIQNAAGLFFEPRSDPMIFFTLHNFRTRSK